MVVIPAIDLKDGRCVRLRQGAMDQETRYSDDPVGMALHWQALGASSLHVVDLNGAIEGQPTNTQPIEAMAHRLGIPIQVGGGIRSLETIRRYISMGVGRVILGTAVLEDVDLIGKACEEFPSQILIGLDVRNGSVALHGWTSLSPVSPEKTLASLATVSPAGVIFTDISRDGMLKGPNLLALQSIAQVSPFPVIASGGITGLDDIQAIKRLGEKMTAVIIGKALYEGTIDLTAAIKVGLSEEVAPC